MTKQFTFHFGQPQREAGQVPAPFGPNLTRTNVAIFLYIIAATSDSFLLCIDAPLFTKHFRPLFGIKGS